MSQMLCCFDVHVARKNMIKFLSIWLQVFIGYPMGYRGSWLYDLDAKRFFVSH